MQGRFAALIAAAFAVGSAFASLKEEHRVTNLPGVHTKPLFEHFAGRLELKTEEKLFYWYTESQDKPSTDPLVLWLNGGPGCSSLGGFFTENGPFVVRNDLTLEENPYAWNRHANLVWLESPAGVGFSAPLQNASYYNDDMVAQRTYDFLELWINEYAELKNRDFYVTGESYGGIYIPYLINLLVERPIAGLNLRGFAIGNAYTDNVIDNNAYMDYYYSHAIISPEDYIAMGKACGKQLGACVDQDEGCPQECSDAINVAMASANEDSFDPYFIYGDVCQLNNKQGSILRYKPTTAPAPSHRGDIGPCADTYTQFYLRLPAVQKALHVGEFIKWTDCSDPVGDMYIRPMSALPKYRNILKANLSVLIYSGDADSVVNFIGTQRWIGSQGLNLEVVDKWHAWFGPDSQHAGYVQEYKGLTFKTVKGAGHMVPATRPLHGLAMFECFLFGNATCNDFDYPIDEEEVEAALPIVYTYSQDLHVSTTNSGFIGTSMFLVLGAVSLAVIASVAMLKNLHRREPAHEYVPLA